MTTTVQGNLAKSKSDATSERKRGVACRARTVVRNSSGSPGVNLIEKEVSLFQQEQTDDDNKKTYRLIDIGRAIDIKSHESAIADPTKQLTLTDSIAASTAHSSNTGTATNSNPPDRQCNNKWEKEGEKEEKGREEREKGRKCERLRTNRSRRT